MDASEIVNFEISNEVQNEVIPATLNWGDLTGEKTILPNHIEEKKKRGRPRKYRPGAGGKTMHRMDSLQAPVTKILNKDTINLIHEEFKRFHKLHKMSLTDTLNAICERHEIDYKQAYAMLKDEI